MMDIHIPAENIRYATGNSAAPSHFWSPQVGDIVRVPRSKETWKVLEVTRTWLSVRSIKWKFRRVKPLSVTLVHTRAEIANHDPVSGG